MSLRKAFLEEYGDEGPWTCDFCEEEIESARDLVVRHAFDKEDDESADNAMGVHKRCHWTINTEYGGQYE